MQAEGDFLPLQFYEEGQQLRLLEKGGASIDVTCPIRIFHGLQDTVVPSTCSTRLVECLKATDVHLTLIKVLIMQLLDFQ